MSRRSKHPPKATSDTAARNETPLRIIGGTHARRHLRYSGDARTRPMKDRVREALFNLVGPSVVGKQAIDLFAGTGALGLEAISRGAARATLIEQHFPTAAIIRGSIADLGFESRAEVIPASAFAWARRLESLGDQPWLVFCSPPYDFYQDRQEDMLTLITRLAQAAPGDSIFAVEADQRFDFSTLHDAARWDVRDYPPARIGIFRMAAKTTEPKA